MNNLAENKLVHSSSAISISHSFYNKRVMVYVEGDDDVSFWYEIFNKYAPANFCEIEQVKGKNNLQTYLNGIENGGIENALVACDSDYNSYLDTKKYSSPYIIFTYGHSIENSMFCPAHIAAYVRRLTHDVKTNHSETINNWIDDFCNISMKLLTYDIASIKYGVPVKCLSNGCDRFMRGNTSKIDAEEVERFVNELKSKFNEEQIETVRNLLNTDERDKRYIMQGHYYASGIMRFIRAYIGKIPLSNDAIKAEFVSCNKECGSVCKDQEMLALRIKSAVDAFQKSDKANICNFNSNIHINQQN